ncbi:MAG: hypothetical protein EB084_04680 [Proteobacteria bacterium]|nr:hypothetical protein [Pseudomonadota bacterium]
MLDPSSSPSPLMREPETRWCADLRLARNLRGLFVLLILSLLTTVAALPARAQDDDLIVPGERISWMHVGGEWEPVEQAFGSHPRKEVRVPDKGYVVYTYTNDGFQFYIDRRNTMTAIILRDFTLRGQGTRYHTAGGITLGSTRSQVISELGTPLENGHFMRFNNGIIVEMNGDRVTAIEVLPSAAK